MNTESVDLVLFPTGTEAMQHGPGGACWADDHGHLFIMFPGAKNLDAIPVSRDREATLQNSRLWYWNGNVEKPTLDPSLLAAGEWHGYLRGGRLVSC